MYSLKIVDIPADKMKTEKLMDIIEKLRVNDEFCDAPAFIVSFVDFVIMFFLYKFVLAKDE